MENSVVLFDYMGGDNLHAVNAWASTFLELGLELPDDIHARTDALTDAIQAQGKRKRSVPDLLNYLANSTPAHTSPFRASKFIFGMTIETATHIQLLTHTVAIEHTNAESARYKELMEDKYYLPADWLNYGERSKALYDRLKTHTELCNELYHEAILVLTEEGMSKQRAKESARFFKGYNSQLNAVRSMSFDGLMQLYQKRGEHSPSQREIAKVVGDMVQAVKDIPGDPFKHSLAAFGV